MRTWFQSKGAPGLGHLAQRFCTGNKLLQPRAFRVHKVALHVKNEFAFITDPCLSQRRFERGFLCQIEKSACPACGSIRGIECKKGGSGATSGNEKMPP